MSTLSINQFSGIHPRYPDSLLPEHAATAAENCDFGYGELRNTNGGFQLSAMVNNPRSIYTDDGLTFFTWTTDVDAVASPMVADTYNRMYYADGSSFRVTRRDTMSLTGGPPGTSYAVGVPKPTVKPSLTNLLPTITTATHDIEWRFHYEVAGTKYQESAAAVAVLSTNKWTLTPPAVSGDTPKDAVAVLRMKATDKATSKVTFDLYTNVTPTTGPFTLTMSKDSGATYTAVLDIALRESDKDTRAYVYTYVNIYGEEGPPSPPATIDTGTDMEVDAAVTKDDFGQYATITAARIYRTPTGSNTADFFYVGEVSLSGVAFGATTTYADKVKPALLNEPISSTNFYPPPANLTGLMLLPNGILMAWRGKELWFSEAYKPWAWPPQYVKPLSFPVVGGSPHGAGAVVTTKASPYLVNGVSPDSMSVTKVNISQAGVGKRSIASVDGMLVYASHDGLVAINGATGSTAIGERFFTRDVWRARYKAGLDTMAFSVWDGRLVVFSTTAAFRPFMIRMDEAAGTMTELPGLVATAGFVSPTSDQFYYARGNSLYQFNGGTPDTCLWRSREAYTERPVNFGACLVNVGSGTWTVEIYANGTLRKSKAVTAGVTTFRLPSGYKADRWVVKLQGSGAFKELRLAESPSELARV